MSTLRHGKIERAIAAAIAADLKGYLGRPGTVLITSDGLVNDLYRPRARGGGHDWDWKPSPAHRKAVTRAMHTFVRKHQQYALTGGQGRRQLFLYDTADPVSVMWAKLNVERRHRKHITISDAKAALRQMAASEG